ncbi:MAG: hypothetical protein LBJ22_02430 [Synergistaceae bacterium]|jgi:uncharacterized protein YukE|nr:hypothetical protein [Synergistaceae bacterium]
MGLSDLKNTLSKIFIHKEEMRKDIAYLREAAEKFRTAAGVCRRGVDSSRWAGESADIFTERYTGLTRSIDGQADECERAARKMDEVIRLFEQAERDVQAQIKNFASRGNG